MNFLQNLPVTDTHIHIWDLQRSRYAWLEGETSLLNRTYQLDELEMERTRAGIIRGVLVQAANHLEDTDAMIEAAHMHPWIKGVVGWLPLMDPVATQELLDNRFKSAPLFKGCRHLIHNEADPRWLLQDTVLESLTILAEREIPFDVVGIHTDHLQTVKELVRRIPKLRIILDHLNQPPIASGEHFGLWGDLMKELSTHPQVYVKISGLGTTAARGFDWDADDIGIYIAYTLSLYGAERCLCGGDWPVSLLAGSYTRTWDTYRQILDSLLTEEEVQMVLHSNAGKFYNLE